MEIKEYCSEILDKKFNEGWTYTEIMKVYNCSYPEIKNLVEKYKNQYEENK